MDDNGGVPLGDLETQSRYDLVQTLTNNSSGINNDGFEFVDEEDGLVDLNLNNEINDCPYDNVAVDCHYYNETTFLQRFKNNKKNHVFKLECL